MDYLKYLADEIHTTVMATVDNDGLPVTCAIDIMDSDKNGLYFLTAKGKGFYNRLKKNGYIALSRRELNTMWFFNANFHRYCVKKDSQCVSIARQKVPQCAGKQAF